MGRKALKRKLGKRVLSGKLTVDEARARLGRATVQKSAWSTWPAQPSTAASLTVMPGCSRNRDSASMMARQAAPRRMMRAALGGISRW